MGRRYRKLYLARARARARLLVIYNVFVNVLLNEYRICKSGEEKNKLDKSLAYPIMFY